MVAEYEEINEQSSIPEQDNDNTPSISTGVSSGGGSMGGGGY